MVGALEIRVGSHHLQQVYINQLKTIIQHQSESLQNYGADIEKLVRIAYPDVPEQFGRQLGVGSCIDGVRDIQLQQAIRLEHFAEIKYALLYSLEYEAAKSVNCQQHNTHPKKV